jgi:hypothetical protein
MNCLNKNTILDSSNFTDNIAGFSGGAIMLDNSEINLNNVKIQ